MIPANRAVSYSRKIAYGLYRVTAAPEGNWAKVGATYLLADALAESVVKAAKVESFEKLRPVEPAELAGLMVAHPLATLGYGFDVPMLDGDHVTAEAGTGFVHTAPSHGRDDFDIWTASNRMLRERGIDPRIPYTVDADGFLTADAPGFTGRRVYDDKGVKGDANEAVIKALITSGNLVARGRLKHQYPHSWRSKKPLIFRNTPQWFIALDQSFEIETSSSLMVRRPQAVSNHEAVPQCRLLDPRGSRRCCAAPHHEVSVLTCSVSFVAACSFAACARSAPRSQAS